MMGLVGCTMRDLGMVSKTGCANEEGASIAVNEGLAHHFAYYEPICNNGNG